MQGLLGLKQLDIYEMANSGSDAAHLLSELNALHSREVASCPGPYVGSRGIAMFLC